jgi:hypothetical protein
MRLRAALLTVLAGAALAVPAAPAAAAACWDSSGVTVVVDFASLGGGTQSGCAAGDPSSGLAALRATGHTTTRAAQQPGYFLCRIDGKPANDPCQRTSPANAYWSYWHAKPGGSWTYSDLGPADYDPKPGTVEGWAFGAGKPPSSPPPRAAASPRPAASSPPPSRAPMPPASPVPVSPVAVAPAASGPAAAVTAQPARTTPVPSASPSAEVMASASPTAEPVAADPPPGTVRSRPNKYAGPVTAAVLLLLIGAAGVRRLRLRRREIDG